jgi:exonuclease SbcD
LADAAGDVAFCTIPYAEPAIAADELACPSICDHDTAMRAAIERIRTAVPSGRAVLMAHAFVPGTEESESERALTVGGTGTVATDAFDGFAYVALGHLHRAQALGDGRIRYSGSILKYAFSEESHVKTVELVDMDEAGRCNVERVALTARREVRTLTGRFDELLRDPVGAREDLLAVTLLDSAPILDAKLRLNEIYPNLLQVQQPNFLRPGTGPLETPDYGAMHDSELFAAFFKQVTGRELSSEEAAELGSVLESFRMAQREALV